MKELKNKRYKDMKKLLMILMVVALVALPTMAQQLEWQSTSTMQGTNSTYVPQVTAVGATTVEEMATTTETYSPAQAPTNGPRKINPVAAPTPVGDALIPLMLCAGAYLIIRARRRMVRSKMSEKGMEK